MRIVQLVPGSGDRFYCENCARDDSLIRGLRARDHDVYVAPLYLPLSTEYEWAKTAPPIFYGAANLYVSHTIGNPPRWAKRILDSKTILGIARRFAGSTDAGELGEITISMLKGEEGRETDELARLGAWLEEIRPDIIHLSNGLLVGLAPDIRRRLDVPIVCSLQDEHTWLDSLSRASEREAAWDLLRAQSAAVDLFLPVSRYYEQFMTRRLGLSSDRMRAVPVGIDTAEFPMDRGDDTSEGRQTIGYMSNMSPEMGFGLLADAFTILKQTGDFEHVDLAATGGFSNHQYLRTVLHRLKKAGLGRHVRIAPSFQKSDRIRFLSDLSLVCVPVLEGEAFGTFILESLAAAVPVVEPKLGGFPELVEATGGGVLYQPNSASVLASTLSEALSRPKHLLEMGEAGRKAVHESYTIERMAAAMEAAFTFCIKKRTTNEDS